MKKLFAQYNEGGAVDCDIHNATLSDISALIKSRAEQAMITTCQTKNINFEERKKV